MGKSVERRNKVGYGKGEGGKAISYSERAFLLEGEGREIPRKHPALAATLSLFVWGLGQIYIRRGRRGAILILGMAFWWGVVIALGSNWREVSGWLKAHDIGLSVYFVFALSFLCSGILIWTVSIWDSYFLAIRARALDYTGLKRPILTALCSAAISGWGQILNGQIAKGLIFLSIFLFGILGGIYYSNFPLFWGAEVSDSQQFLEVLLIASLAALCVGVVFWLYAVLDAYVVANRDRRILRMIAIERSHYGDTVVSEDVVRRRLSSRARLFDALKLLVLFIAILSIVGYAIFTFRSSAAWKLNEKANFYFQQDMVRAPIFLERLALILDDGNPDLHESMARFLFAAGEYRRAVEEYRRVVSIDPTHTAVHNRMGNIYFELGDYDRAIDEYSFVLTKPSAGPKARADAHNGLGDVYAALGDIDGAVEHFKEALNLDANNRYAKMRIRQLR
ncbi:MAG: tetratricopeptide repeat protein [bacterium]